MLVDCGPDLRQQLLAAEVEPPRRSDRHPRPRRPLPRDRRAEAGFAGDRAARSAPRARRTCSTSCRSGSAMPSPSPNSIARSSRRASSARSLRFGGARDPLRRSAARRTDIARTALRRGRTFSRLCHRLQRLNRRNGLALRRRRRVDRGLPDAPSASDPCPSRRRARMGAGFARRASLSRSHGQRARLSFARSPSCPTGQRRPMTGSRSPHDDQRPDARRGLHPDGDHARARLADGAARAAGEAADHGAGVDRDLRGRLRPVHASATISAISLSASRPKHRIAGHRRGGNAHPDGASTAISGSTPSSTAAT